MQAADTYGEIKTLDTTQSQTFWFVPVMAVNRCRNVTIFQLLAATMQLVANQSLFLYD
jgi:hypothetical protein